LAAFLLGRFLLAEANVLSSGSPDARICGNGIGTLAHVADAAGLWLVVLALFLTPPQKAYKVNSTGPTLHQGADRAAAGRQPGLRWWSITH
jgi:hypothetical protein